MKIDLRQYDSVDSPLTGLFRPIEMSVLVHTMEEWEYEALKQVGLEGFTTWRSGFNPGLDWMDSILEILERHIVIDLCEDAYLSDGDDW